jgi:hypothetical protein
MTLKVSNKDSFLNNFLIPISKVSDSVVLDINKDKIQALIATQDNTVIVNAIYTESANELAKKLNIPDIKKLCRILQCIDEQSIVFTVDTNSISYTSESVRFKYHLYDDSIISVPKLNLAKLEQLNFNGTFSLKQATILSLIKGSTIATDTNKIYVGFRESVVYGELTDKARANVDSYGLKISEDYSGVPIPNSIPLNFEIFRIISSIKFDTLKGKLAADTGVFIFNMTTGTTEITFIVSALAN